MHSEFTFPSCDGHTSLHAEAWIPQRPLAVVQLIHGMVEHIGRYRPFAQWLEEQGFAVYGHDHLGHGASSRQEDWGFFRREKPAEALLTDIHSLRLIARVRHPDLPFFMLGHSMGSYLLRAYLTSHGEGLSGAVIMGTGFLPAGVTRAGLGLIRCLEALRGPRHRSALVESLVFGKDYSGFDMSGQNPGNSWLTKDEAIVRQYYSDPRTTFRFTLNGYQGLLEAVQAACDPALARKIPGKLPLLLVSGAQDPVGAAGAGVRQTEAQLRAAGLADVTLRLFEGDRHEILNETDRAEVYAFIGSWLRDRL